MMTLLRAALCFEANLDFRSGPHGQDFSKGRNRGRGPRSQTRTSWQEQTETARQHAANPPPAKSFPLKRKSSSAPMKSISSATALPAIPSRTGSAPNAKSSRKPANPPRKLSLWQPDRGERRAIFSSPGSRALGRDIPLALRYNVPALVLPSTFRRGSS